METVIRCRRCMREYDGQYDMCPYCGETKIQRGGLYFLPLGTVLAQRYQIGAYVGSGGFGITYRAWDYALAKEVALKEYYPAGLVNRIPGEKQVIIYSGRKEMEYSLGKSRFLEEARNMAQYNTHDNIVNVYDYFEENGTAYIVMEFLDGVNYKEYLEGKSLQHELEPVQEALEVMRSVLTALSEVHKCGILHRDISPDNIFLCRDGRVKLIDFGAARFSPKDGTANMTVILKPGYAPPEQYQSKGRQGVWIDIYAAGATLYRAVTGMLPEESVNRTEEDTLIPPKELRREISRNLNNAILRAMSLQPELRFQSAEEFMGAISGEIKVRDVGKELKWRKTFRWMTIAAAAAVVSVGIWICMSTITQQKEAAAIVEPADITLWACAASGEGVEEKREWMEEALESFREEYPQVNVTVTCIEEQEYEARLREAMDRGELPTLFDSSCLYREDYGYLADLGDVFSFLKPEDYYFFNRYWMFFPNKKQLPLAFTMPVVYYCSLANPEGKHVDTLVEEGDFLVSPGGYFTWYNLYGGGDAITDFRNWKEAEAWAETELSDGEEFLGLQTACLLADSSSYEWVQENMPGIYVMGFWREKGMTGAFRDCFSIAEDASGEEKTAAVQALAYLLTDQAQDIMYVQNGSAFPLNKEAYKAYVEINAEFEGLEAGINKTAMAGESQALVDRWLREMVEMGK